MSNKNFDIYFDFGSSKIRAAAFKKNDTQNNFYVERDCISKLSVNDLLLLSSDLDFSSLYTKIS